MQPPSACHVVLGVESRENEPSRLRCSIQQLTEARTYAGRKDLKFSNAAVTNSFGSVGAAVRHSGSEGRLDRAAVSANFRHRQMSLE